MEQYVNLLHFDKELENNNLKNYEKFDRNIKNSPILYQNGASLHIAPSNDTIPQTWSFDGAISELAPFSYNYSDFCPQQKKVVTDLFHFMME